MWIKWPIAIAIAFSPLVLAATSMAAADTGSPQADQQATPPATPAPAPEKGASDKKKEPPPSVTIIGPAEAYGILGRDVRSSKGENMGRIVDVIVDRGGTVRAAVIDFGGFLGVGSRKIVVDWNALHFGGVEKKSGSITLDLTREQVKAAPEYAEDKPIVVLGASGSLQPLHYSQ